MVANPWPLHFHAAAVVADLALRMAPAITPTVPMATMSGPAHGRGVLLHHLGQGLDPGQETEPIHAETDCVHRVCQRRHRKRGGKGFRATGTTDILSMVSFSLLGLQHPEPDGSRRATPTSTFQHPPGHPLAMRCIAATGAPSREPRQAVSLGLYHWSLVLGNVTVMPA